ncbi:MAG: hypothetical protein GC193_11900 [Cryomorphaceae bacterium]|nr:hypothetical protein [Cryomorphaceae bacterium]
MKHIQFALFLSLFTSLISCKQEQLENKGFQVSPTTEDTEQENDNGLNGDSLKFDTQPSEVLLTGIARVRLASIYKVNVKKSDGQTFIGSNNYHYAYNDVGDYEIDDWNYHLIPGMEAVYGYNFVNVAHFNFADGQQKHFFEEPVLIRTLYYPSFQLDSLAGAPVVRNYFMVSVYDQDTNNDHFINLRDLRRFYLIDSNGENKTAIVPEDYSIFKSEYDPQNDKLFVFARHDSNSNGQIDISEPISIFWVDLKDPGLRGKMFE